MGDNAHYKKQSMEVTGMATLNCSDGTVVQISAETEAELRKAFERTYKIGNIFWRSADDKSEYMQLVADNGDCVALHHTSENSNIKIHRSVCVQDINAITYNEVCAMTMYPKGLRHIKTFAVTEL